MDTEQFQKAVRINLEIREIEDEISKANKLKETDSAPQWVWEGIDTLFLFDFISRIKGSQILDNYIEDLTKYKDKLEKEFSSL